MLGVVALDAYRTCTEQLADDVFTTGARQRSTTQCSIRCCTLVHGTHPAGAPGEDEPV